MKTTKIFLLSFLVALNQLSCGANEIMRCDLTKDQELVIPYEKGHVYGFINGFGTAVNDVTVTEITEDWLKSRDEDTEDYFTYKKKSVTLESKQSNLKVFLNLTANGCLNGGDYCTLEVGFLPKINEKCTGFNLSFDAEGNLKESNYNRSIYDPTFHKSIEINGHVYYNVVELNFRCVKTGVSQPYDIPMQLFYNKTNGVLEVKSDGKTYLKIDPKTQKAEDVKAKNNTEPEPVELAVEETDSPFDFIVYPNPNDGYFTITLDTKETQH